MCSARVIIVMLSLVACRTAPVVVAVAAADAAPDSDSDSDSGSDSDSDSDSGSDPEMLFVPAGTFTMGADHGGDEDEHPAHPVTLPGFWLDRAPVTNAAYALCVSAQACRESDRVMAEHHSHALLAPQHPVVGVSWDEAKAYCAWRAKRLPREEEYEHAMRGDDNRKYAWGNERPTHERAVFERGYPGGSTDDVGTHPAGRGPFGHDDLAGNVWEWCDDLYDPYAYRRTTPATCPEILATQDELRAHGLQGFTGSNPIPIECEHVLRGGGYNYEADGLRATNRVHHPARFRIAVAGFRCARD